MTKKQVQFNHGKIIIYQPKKGEVELKVQLLKETVWLSLDQMVILFGRDKSVISRHLKNIFMEKELDKKSVVANFATTAADGKIYNVDYYNLDVIISVGYRVKSQQGVNFRIWATKILRQYLLQGYAVNEKRLLEAQNKFNQLKSIISLLQKKSKAKRLKGQEAEILNLLADYAKTLTLLEKYDKNKLKTGKGAKASFVLDYKDCQNIIFELKKNLLTKKEASDIFGREVNHKFESVVKTIYQTFDRKELYPSIENKAANLLYLAIKDHPFTDGNKRIGSFLFVYFLDKNNYLYRPNGEKKINDNALTALAILTAESNPKEKDQLIALIVQLIK